MAEHEKCKVCGFPHDGTDHSDCIFAQSKEIERLRSELDKRKFSEQDVINAARSAFEDGTNWAETYTSWFTPTDEQNTEEKNKAINVALVIASTHLPEPPEVL